jgi:tetratricopeptide (TPR) repeat protein
MKLKTFGAISIFLSVLLFTVATVRADQNDTRLDNLFTRLKSIDNSDEANPIINRIWTIWIETPDPALRHEMRRGMAAMHMANYKLALKSFNTIIEAEPDFAEGWNKRATLYYMMGQFTASMADVYKTLSLEPRHFGALSGMGLILMETGNDRDAISAFEEALKANPHMPSIDRYIDYLKEKIEQNTI